MHSAPKPSQFKLHSDYLIRECRASGMCRTYLSVSECLCASLDLPAIKEMCENVYGGADYMQLQFLEYLQDKNAFVYGVEHKETRQIVSSIVIIIQDGGIKAMLKGNRTHKDHRKKGLNSCLQQYAMINVQKFVSNLRVFEATTHSDNRASVKSQDKNGLKVINSIQYATVASLTQPKEISEEFGLLLDAFDENASKYKTYRYEEDIEHIVDVLGNKYHCKQILFDWMIHKIDYNKNECIQSVIQSLTKEFKLNRMECIINSNETLLCLINRMAPPVLQFHFYCCADVDAMDVIHMMKYLYSQWKNGSKYKDRKWIRVFLDKTIVDNDEKLSGLFGHFNWDCIVMSNDPKYYD